MNRGDIKLAYDRAIAHDVPDVADRLVEMAERIEALEAELAATQATGWRKAKERIEQLEAHNAKLREALGVLSESVGRFVSDEGWQQLDMDNMDAAYCLLAQPTDTTALEALIAKAGEVMRERCAVRAIETGDYMSVGKHVAGAIRALPGVTLDDLKGAD